MSRVIDGPKMDSDSKYDLSEASLGSLPTDRKRRFEGRGALKDFEIGEGGGGDVKRPDLVGLGIRVRGEIDSLEPEGEVF